MTISRLWQVTPFASGGVFLMGGMFAGIYGLPAVYGIEKGLTFDHIGIFIGALFAGSLIMQYPMGWLSDRMNRRLLIVITVFIGAIACGFGAFIGNDIVLLSSVAFIFGRDGKSALYALQCLYQRFFRERGDGRGLRGFGFYERVWRDCGLCDSGLADNNLWRGCLFYVYDLVINGKRALRAVFHDAKICAYYYEETILRIGYAEKTPTSACQE